MKTIVAPTDFSAVSLNAVRYAADIARATNSSLHLVHVYSLPIVFGDIPYPAVNMAELASEAEQRIQQLKDEMNNTTGRNIKIYTQIKAGTVLTEIKALCDDVRPHAVVMGTHGTGAMERLLFGSNTIAAINHLSWPLVIVPPDAKFSGIRKVGLACDLKKVAETSPISEIKKIVKDFGADLRVVHVNAEGNLAYGPDTIEQSGYLQEMLDDLHPTYDFLNNTGVEEGLTSYAERHQLDLLIVIPRKHNLIDKLLHKSHTKELVRHTRVPIVAVHETTH